MTRKIKDIIPLSGDHPSTSPSVQQPWRAEIIQRYGSAERFMALFNPSMQFKYAAHPERCHMGDAPSLCRLAETFGHENIESWIEIQVNDLSEFAGCREKLSTQQREDAARAILSAAPYIKATELMLFFTQYKKGAYGHFYGAVDAMRILSAFQEFLLERRETLNRLEHEANIRRQAETRARWRQEAITREEYEEVRWLFNMGYERDADTGKIK